MTSKTSLSGLRNRPLVSLNRLLQFSTSAKGLHPVNLACLQANQTNNQTLKEEKEKENIFESSASNVLLNVFVSASCVAVYVCFIILRVTSL